MLNSQTKWNTFEWVNNRFIIDRNKKPYFQWRVKNRNDQKNIFIVTIVVVWQKKIIKQNKKMHVRVNSKATFNNDNSKNELLPSKIMKIFTSENSRLSSRRRLTTSHAKTGSSKMHNYTYNSIISLQSCVFLPILLLLLIGESNYFCISWILKP